MRDIEEIKRDLSYDASWWQPADLHSIACDLLAEVERLRAESKRLRQYRDDMTDVAEQWRVMYIDACDALSQFQDRQAQVAERICEWHAVKDNWDGRYFESACDDAWMAGEEETPEETGYIYCPTCGGKITFIDDDDCEEDDDDR